MDREEQVKAVAEAYALQGKVDGLDQKCRRLQASIDDQKKELERLESISAAKKSDEEKLAVATEEFTAAKGELQKLLDDLASVDVKLPLGKNKPVKFVSM